MRSRLIHAIARTPASQPAGGDRGAFMTGTVVSIDGVALNVQLPGGIVHCQTSSDQPFFVGDQVLVATTPAGPIVMGLA